MSKCPGTNVPGFTESEEVVKQNRNMEMRMSQFMDEVEKKKDIQPISLEARGLS